MNGDSSIPPTRDLPPGRLAQRREHLVSEIAQPRSRLPLPRRGLLALVAAALIVVVGTASAIGGVRAFILDQGFIGLPPMGATPSAPESGELVVYLDRHHFRASVYADGRMIWQRDTHGPLGAQVPGGANEATSGYLEQRLTQEGVELVRAAVAGLVDRSRSLLEPVPDDPRWGPLRLALFVPHPDTGGWWGSMDVPDGDRLVRLQWRTVGGNAEEDALTRENFEGTIATPEQLAALRRVEAVLTDPASVLPASAWAVREVRAYVPSHYAVCMSTSPPKDPSDLLSLLPARAADILRDKGRKQLDGEVVDAREGYAVVLGESVTYCSKLTTVEAREVADAVSGLERTEWPLSLVYRVAEGVNNWEETQISFDPYLPHGVFLLHDGGR
jgi:hypothetical protein